ncbi:hypothetical protein [Aureimonas sp. Leaf454]|uniref:hypothetical protein n=1 Tax=Aureimonas sp. Leaf454 TaxID=1736381 RepID=UPI0012E39D47|nr:hypothetical protein [Aureimonas sp. Leaf454]
MTSFLPDGKTGIVRSAMAFWMVLALSHGAAAFSQIGTKDGAAPQREGIVSVPLPPLAGSASPAEPTVAPSEPTRPSAPALPGGEPASPAAPTGSTQASPPVSSTEPVSPPAGEAVPSEDATPPEDAGPTGETPLDGAASESGVPPGAAATVQEDRGPPPAIAYGDDGLPQPVRDLRARLIEIAKAGEIEALRPYIQTGEDGTLLSFGGAEGDPIAYLKTTSGDGDGVEVLAILLEVLEAGHVRSEPDSDNEIYIWPYFTAVSVDKLTKPQKVELFELVTAGDYQEMLGFGAYNFYRVGISPDGKLQFFVAGD